MTLCVSLKNTDVYQFILHIALIVRFLEAQISMLTIFSAQIEWQYGLCLKQYTWYLKIFRYRSRVKVLRNFVWPH